MLSYPAHLSLFFPGSFGRVFFLDLSWNLLQDMIDDALLRPGRLEVHVEIGLPDEAGRMQILNIHTRGMVSFLVCTCPSPPPLKETGGGAGGVGRGVSSSDCDHLYQQKMQTAILRVFVAGLVCSNY